MTPYDQGLWVLGFLALLGVIIVVADRVAQRKKGN